MLEICPNIKNVQKKTTARPPQHMETLISDILVVRFNDYNPLHGDHRAS